MKNSVHEKLPEATVFGSYGYAWQQLWKQFLYFFVVALIVALADAPFSNLRDMEWENGMTNFGQNILAMAYGVLFLPVIKFGGDQLFLRGIRNETMELGELFIGFKKNYLNIVLAYVITVALIIIGVVFLIVPGIILACRLVFVSYLVMDKNLEPVAALEKSWAMTKGYGWRIFGMVLLAIPLFVAGLLCFIIGAFVAVIWVQAAFAALYHAIDLQEEANYAEQWVGDKEP